MTSGKPFSKDEEQYIRTHCRGMFASMLARNLVILFPKDNGGERDSESVKRFMKRNKII